MSPTSLLMMSLVVALSAADKAAVTVSPQQSTAEAEAEGRSGDAARDLQDLQDMDGDASDTKMMAASGGAGAAAMHGHGKFFQYGHHDGKDHYENGFRRGNEHHFQERHEKAAPKHGHFTTKVRWGDKHGGYGEHYWDYNHGGHHGDGDGGGEGSAPVPDIAEQRDDTVRPQFKRQSFLDQSGAASGASASGTESPGGGSRRAYRKKYVRPATTTVAPTHPVPRARTTARPPPHRQDRQPPPPTPTVAMAAKSSKTAFFPSDFPGSVFQAGVPTSPLASSAVTSASLAPRNARQTPGQAQNAAAAGLARRLAFDPRTGRVHDEDTGQVFVLQPVS